MFAALVCGIDCSKIVVYWRSHRFYFKIFSQNDLCFSSFKAYINQIKAYSVDGCEPEAMICCVIVASSFTVALNEWNGVEVLKARAWRFQILSGTFSAGGCVL
jgi:hypothetical protein